MNKKLLGCMNAVALPLSVSTIAISADNINAENVSSLQMCVVCYEA